MDQVQWIDTLFQSYAKELYRYLRRFSLSEDEIYDLVQDAFVGILKAQPSQIRHPKAWLFTVARNLALNKRKSKRSRREEGEGIDRVEDPGPGALFSMLENEDRALLWRAYSMLPAKDREMMDLYLDNDFTYRQIARILGRSEVSVRVAMHRSRKQLRRLLSRLEG